MRGGDLGGGRGEGDGGVEGEFDGGLFFGWGGWGKAGKGRKVWGPRGDLRPAEQRGEPELYAEACGVRWGLAPND